MKKPWRKNESNSPRRRLRSDDSSGEQRQTVERLGSTLFRRNRTLVGSLSPTVSSANEMGGDLKSPRAHVHHLTAHRRRLGTTLLVVLVTAGVLTLFLYSFTAFIHISAHGGGAVQQDRYTRIINDYLGGRPGERLRMLLNEDQLMSYLSHAAPEVESIHVSGSAGIGASQFDIVFRKPVAGWLIGSTQYYVDKDGISFQINYFDRPTVKIVDQSGVPQSTGTTVASSRFLRFVGRTVELAGRSNLIVEQAIIPASTTRQIEVRLVGRNYPIKLSLDRSVGEQVEDMQRAVAFFDTRNLKPAYVDIRVSGKAFYK